MATPKLRFKEFGGDWELDLLGNLVQIKSGYSPSKYELDKSGEMPFLKVEELNNCDKYQEYSRFYTERNSDAVPSKSVVFPKRGAAILNNKVRILRVDALLDSNLMALIPQHSLDAEYLYYLINKIELYKIADTSTIPQINNKHIEPYSIYSPSKEEQTKIASFLSNVDEKISQLNQKHELLSQYKQGMMQKLFSQQLRFKADDGSEFGEWESISIKSAVSFIKDGTHGTHQDDPTSHLFLLSAKNLQNGHVVIDEKDRRINKLEFDSIYKNYGLNTGDILLSVVGTIGRVAIFKEEYKNYAFQRSVAFMRFKSAKPEFIFQLFNAVDFQNELLVRQVVSAQPGIYLGDLSKIEIKLPCQEEQTKIANFLSAIDQKIEVVAQQIEQAKQWKKGLLQQMFV
nr:restriction endonuclease subunit S [Acinetobacter sp. YH12058]